MQKKQKIIHQAQNMQNAKGYQTYKTKKAHNIRVININYQTNNARLHFFIIETMLHFKIKKGKFRVVSQTYFNSDYMHDQFLCSQSLHGVRNWHYLNGKVSWVYEMYIWGKYIPNKQGLILSLKTNSAFCFLWVTWLFISGAINQVLDNMTWGEMTSGWLEQLLGVL